MSEQKNYCQTHHYYYIGNVCPFCEKERIQKMVDQYAPKEKKEVIETKKQDREINEEDLAMLINKFNVR